MIEIKAVVVAHQRPTHVELNILQMAPRKKHHFDNLELILEK